MADNMIPTWEESTPVENNSVIPTWEESTPVQTEYKQGRMETWSRIRESFAGNNPLLFAPEDKRMALEEVVSAMENPELEKKKLALAAYYSGLNNQDFSFVYSNIEQMIEVYEGKNKSVDAAFRSIAESFHPEQKNGEFASALYSGLHKAGSFVSGLLQTGVEYSMLNWYNADDMREKLYHTGDIWKTGEQDIAPVDYLRQQKKIYMALAEYHQENAGVKSLEDEFTWKNFGKMLLSEGPSLLLQMAAFSNPYTAAGTVGTFTNDKYEDLTENNPEMSPLDKTLNILFTTVINSADAIIGRGLMKAGGKVAKEKMVGTVLYFLKKVGIGMGVEGGTEGAQRLAENVVDIYTGVYDKELAGGKVAKAQLMRRGVLDETLLGGIAGAPMRIMGFQHVRDYDMQNNRNIAVLESEQQRLKEIENPNEEEQAKLEFISVALDSGELRKITETAAEIQMEELRHSYEKSNQQEQDSDMFPDADEETVAAAKMAAPVEQMRQRLPHDPADTAAEVERMRGMYYADIATTEAWTKEQLAAYMQRTMREYDLTEDEAFEYCTARVSALWDNGQVIINTRNMRPFEVPFKLAHEVALHDGIRKAFGDEAANALFDMVWKDRQNHPLMQEILDRYKIRKAEPDENGEAVLDDDGKPVYRELTLEEQREAAEEFLAHLQETNGVLLSEIYADHRVEIDAWGRQNGFDTRDVRQKEDLVNDWMAATGFRPERPSWLKQLISSIRTWLNKHGWFVHHLSDDDILTILAKSARAVSAKRRKSKVESPKSNVGGDVRYSLNGEDGIEIIASDSRTFTRDPVISRGFRGEDYSRTAVLESLETVFNIHHIPENVKNKFIKFLDNIINGTIPDGGKKNVSAGNFASSLHISMPELWKMEGSGSSYAVQNRNIIRVSNHTANAENFKKHADGEKYDNIVSIVLEKGRKRKRFETNDDVDAVEFVFSQKYIEDNEALPVLVYDIGVFLATGEYIDHVGAVTKHFSGSQEFVSKAKEAENNQKNSGNKIRHSISGNNPPNFIVIMDGKEVSGERDSVFYWLGKSGDFSYVEELLKKRIANGVNPEEAQGKLDFLQQNRDRIQISFNPERYFKATNADFNVIDSGLAEKLYSAAMEKQISAGEKIEVGGVEYTLDYVSIKSADSISIYYRSGNSVIRISDHWSETPALSDNKFNVGPVRSSYWTLNNADRDHVFSNGYNSLIGGIADFDSFTDNRPPKYRYSIAPSVGDMGDAAVGDAASSGVDFTLRDAASPGVNQMRQDAASPMENAAGMPHLRYSIDGIAETDARTKNLVAMMKPIAGTVLEQPDSYYAKKMLDKFGIHLDDVEARIIAIEAIRENQKDARERGIRRRNEWLYNNIPLYREAVDFTGKTDFKIKPSSRFHGEVFTGSFISPEFVKWSEEKPQGKKSDKKYQRYLKDREKALKNAEGIDSDTLAEAIARKQGRDTREVKQELIDFFRNLKKPDLYHYYTEWKQENLFADKEQQRQAFEEWMNQEQAKIEDEVVALLEKGQPITEEWVFDNRKVYEELYRQLFSGKQPPYRPGKKDLEAINAALMQQGENASAFAEAYKTAREKAFREFTEKLAAFRDKVMQSRADAVKLQREALDFAEKNLPAEYRGEFARGIVGLLEHSASPSAKYPEGRRMHEFRNLLDNMVRRQREVRRKDESAEIRKMLKDNRITRSAGGNLVSAIPSIQGDVELIRKAVELPRASIAALIELNLERMQAENITEQETEQLKQENRLLETFGALDSRSPEEVSDAYHLLKVMIQDGKRAFRETMERRRTEVELYRKTAIAEANGDNNTNLEHANGRKPQVREYGKFMLDNESLKTLLAAATEDALQNGMDFEDTLAGTLYRKVEDATWDEATRKRKLDDALESALKDCFLTDEEKAAGMPHLQTSGAVRKSAAMGDAASSGVDFTLRDAASPGVNQTRQDAASPMKTASGIGKAAWALKKGKILRGLKEVQEHSGVFKDSYTHNGTGGVRGHKSRSIRIEDYFWQGKRMKGARTLLRELDEGIIPYITVGAYSHDVSEDVLRDEKDADIYQAFPRKQAKDAEAVLESLAGKQLKNRENETLTAEINRRQRDKLKSNAAAQKSIENGFTAQDHLEAVANIEQLYENAVLVHEGPDRKNGDNQIVIRRFIAPMVIDGQIADVLLTQKESLDKENSRKIYSLEVEEIIKGNGVVRPDRYAPSGIQRQTHLDYLPESISKLQQKHEKIKSFLKYFEEKKKEEASNSSGKGGIPEILDDTAVEFLRQQLADYDAGLKKTYDIFVDEKDNENLNKLYSGSRDPEKATVAVILGDPADSVQQIELGLSQLQALQLLLSWEQDGVKAGMKWNGWTDQSIEQLKAFVKPETLKFGYWMRDRIREGRPELDAKSFDRFGAHLPVNEKYFPIAPLHGSRTKIREEAKGFQTGNMNMNPGFLIARKFHLSGMNNEADALDMFLENQTAQVHYLAWENVIRDLKEVYGNTKVKRAIENRYGRDLAAAIEERITALAQDGLPGDGSITGFFEKMYKYSVPAKIALNISSYLKQIAGVFSYMNGVPVADFCKYLAQANRYSKEYLAFREAALASDYLKNRLSAGGMNRDLAAYRFSAKDAKNYSPLADMGMEIATFLTKSGDLTAALHGGFAAYMYAKKKALASGMSKEEAHAAGMRYWQRTTDETQQSGYLKDQNLYQQKRGFYRFATTFMSNTIQTMNLEIQAFRQWKANKSKENRNKLARTVFVNHFVIPTMMKFITDMFAAGLDPEEWWDETELEDYFIAWGLGSFESLFAVGGLLKTVLEGAGDILLPDRKASYRFLRNGFSVMPAADETVRSVLNLMADVMKEKPMTEKDWFDAVNTVGTVSMAAGSASVPGAGIAGTVGTWISALSTQGKRFFRIFNDED